MLPMGEEVYFNAETAEENSWLQDVVNIFNHRDHRGNWTQSTQRKNKLIYFSARSAIFALKINLPKDTFCMDPPYQGGIKGG